MKLKLHELNRPSLEAFKLSTKLPVVVVLDNIRSMMNTGAIFRTSDAFRVNKIYLCGITGQPPHREITKTALGATESVDWEYAENTVVLAKRLKQESYLLLGIEQTNTSVLVQDYVFEPSLKYALFLGNEVEGLSTELLPLLDACIEIPQEGTKHSLNVSVAGGIVLFQAYLKLK
jgi:tRNA G18 (ribose-2'-O)-methylase SpoU